MKKNVFMNLRTTAKSVFSKQETHLIKSLSDMGKRKLQEEFNKLCCLARQVNDANEDYGAVWYGDEVVAKVHEEEAACVN